MSDLLMRKSNDQEFTPLRVTPLLRALAATKRFEN
jgi:hypothetical protein